MIGYGGRRLRGRCRIAAPSQLAMIERRASWRSKSHPASTSEPSSNASSPASRRPPPRGYEAPWKDRGVQSDPACYSVVHCAGCAVGSFRAVDRCLELFVLARERVEVAVESADSDDAGELGRFVVVVEHEVAARREVPEVARDGVMRVWGAFGGQFVREWRGLLDAVVVAERERQGSRAARSRAVALSSSRAVSSVSPKVMRSCLALGASSVGAGLVRRPRRATSAFSPPAASVGLVVPAGRQRDGGEMAVRRARAASRRRSAARHAHGNPAAAEPGQALG